MSPSDFNKAFHDWEDKLISEEGEESVGKVKVPDNRKIEQIGEAYGARATTNKQAEINNLPTHGEKVQEALKQKLRRIQKLGTPKQAKDENGNLVWKNKVTKGGKTKKVPVNSPVHPRLSKAAKAAQAQLQAVDKKLGDMDASNSEHLVSGANELQEKSLARRRAIARKYPIAFQSLGLKFGLGLIGFMTDEMVGYLNAATDKHSKFNSLVKTIVRSYDSGPAGRRAIRKLKYRGTWTEAYNDLLSRHGRKSAQAAIDFLRRKVNRRLRKR